MKIKKKAKGVVLLEAFLALMLMAMASYGLAAVNSVQFSQMAADKDADAAKNYAELEAEYLRNLGYEAVVTDNNDSEDTSRKPRYPEGNQSDVDKASNARDMTKFLGTTLGPEWRSTVTLGTTISNINGDSNSKIQNVVVSVYKTSDGSDASPRATVTVPMSTQGQNRFARNGNAPNQEMIIKYENEDDTVEMPEGKALYAYIDGVKVPLSSQGGGVKDGYSLIAAGIASENVSNLSAYIPNKYRVGYEYQYMISFRDTGGGDNHHLEASVNTGVVGWIHHVQTYYYMIFARKK